MSEPVSITVDAVFDLLNRALTKAVEQGGNPAKAFAWDVNAEFVEELGDCRTRANRPTPIG